MGEFPADYLKLMNVSFSDFVHHILLNIKGVGSADVCSFLEISRSAQVCPPRVSLSETPNSGTGGCCAATNGKGSSTLGTQQRRRDPPFLVWQPYACVMNVQQCYPRLVIEQAPMDPKLLAGVREWGNLGEAQPNRMTCRPLVVFMPGVPHVCAISPRFPVVWYAHFLS